MREIESHGPIPDLHIWYEGYFEGIDEKNGMIFLKSVNNMGHKMSSVVISLTDILSIEPITDIQQ